MEWIKGVLVLFFGLVVPVLAGTFFVYCRILYRKKGKPMPDYCGRAFWTIPNLITLTGSCFVFLAVYYFWQENNLRGLVFLVLAGASDLLDGLTAKYLNQRTVVGEIIDPLRDRLLLLGGIAALWRAINWQEPFIREIFLVLIASELGIGIIALCSVVGIIDLRLRVHMGGKIRQAVHLLLLLVLIVKKFDLFPVNLPFQDSQIIFLMAITSLGAFLVYLGNVRKII